MRGGRSVAPHYYFPGIFSKERPCGVPFLFVKLFSMPYQSFGMLQQQRQIQTLAPQMRQSLEVLHLTTMELRALIQKEMEQNPIIEDVTSAHEIVADTASASAVEIAKTSEAELASIRNDDGAPEEEGGLIEAAPKDGKDDNDPVLDFDKEGGETLKEHKKAILESIK